ncbi:MAG: FadR family transcriptional regulator [bacterium]|nr:FadR family transcriptional regulator [bacterium]
MKFERIGTKKIYIEVIEQIKRMLDSGELKPGDQLPAERDFAELLGISRVSLRQALTVLEALGIVEIRHGEGTFIAFSHNGFDNLNLFLSKISKESDPLDILEARKLIEVEIAGLSAIERVEEDLKAMEEILNEMRKRISIGEDTLTIDLSFHLRISESTHNPVLISVMNYIGSLMKQNLWKVVKGLSLTTPGRAEKYLGQHWIIYSAIREGESVKAKKAMLDHLESIEQDLLTEENLSTKLLSG